MPKINNINRANKLLHKAKADDEYVDVHCRLPRKLYELFKLTVYEIYEGRKGAIREELENAVEHWLDHLLSGPLADKKLEEEVIKKKMEEITKERITAQALKEDKVLNFFGQMIRKTYEIFNFRFPQEIPRRYLHQIIAILRCKDPGNPDRRTILKWEKRLLERGFIEYRDPKKRIVRIKYPFDNLRDYSEIVKHGFELLGGFEKDGRYYAVYYKRFYLDDMYFATAVFEINSPPKLNFKEYLFKEDFDKISFGMPVRGVKISELFQNAKIIKKEEFKRLIEEKFSTALI